MFFKPSELVWNFSFVFLIKRINKFSIFNITQTDNNIRCKVDWILKQKYSKHLFLLENNSFGFITY